MIGRSFLHYQIVDKLGEGGMGIVYRARDTKLQRFVALKFLPHDVHSHEPEKARFVQEARAASALNHPNVCVIHAIEAERGQLCIVMECVEGKTLRQRLSDGPLAVDEVVGYAIQIGEALREAHANGVVHRDIKSDNVMINTRGQIKVMDFGLAKLKGSVKLTKTSSTVGTLAYMAPEQIEGGDVDARTDIFSFGSVLYEMLTGRTPFRGESDAATMYAILNESPEPVQQYRPDLSSELLHVLYRALEKDRADRYQSMNDMLIDLRRLQRDAKRVVRPVPEWAAAAAERAQPAEATPIVPATAPLSPPPATRPPLGWAAAIVAGALLAVAAIALLAFPRRSPPPSHRQLTFTGRAASPTISPDGQSFAYVVDSDSAGDRVMVQDLAGGQPLEIFRAPFCSSLHWAPSGSEVMVYSATDTSSAAFLVPRLGGPPRRVGNTPLRAFSGDGAFNAILGGGGMGRKIKVARPGERASDSLDISGSYIWSLDLDWSPRGDTFLFLTQDSAGFSIRTIRRRDHRQVQTYHDSSGIVCPRWSPRGRAIYFLRENRSSRDLMRLEVGADDQTPRGPPRVLLSGLELGTYFAVSRDGRRLACTRDVKARTVWLGTIKPARRGNMIETKQLFHGTSWIGDLVFSPDSRRLAINMGPGEQSEISILDLVTGVQNQITFLERTCGNPVWSPDGSRIAFAAGQWASANLWIVPSEGGSARRLAKTRLTAGAQLEWRPNRALLYQQPDNRNFRVLDPDREIERPLVANDSLGWMFTPICSPDGKSVVVNWNREPRGLWLLSLADTSQRMLAPGDVNPLSWSQDGKSILVTLGTTSRAASSIQELSVEDGRMKPFVVIPFERITAVSVAPDWGRLACVVSDERSDVWLVENFDPAVK